MMTRYQPDDHMRRHLLDTIGACATPPGQSALAVIRVSGPASTQVGDLLFEPQIRQIERFSALPGYTCAPGFWLETPALADVPKRIDQVVVTRFVKPRSYTGEDMIEISCHGGTSVKQAILDSLFSLGVVPAGPGEFTRRAFLHGKLDLAQAEAVMDLINSEARLQARAAVQQLQGSVSSQISVSRENIYALLARTELILEFPEHEETDESLTELRLQIQRTGLSLQKLADSYRQGRLLSEGLTVVIAGKPNAGKSSLMNRLAGFDRAIVTEIPGTTRDTVKETIEIRGLPVHLVDTAGLRESDDPVEILGVSRARHAMEQADLLIWLISPPLTGLSAEMVEIKEARRSGLPLLLVCGKEDLTESKTILEQLQKTFPDLDPVTFSAISGEGLSKIRQEIYNRYQSAGSGQSEALLLTNSRHREAAVRASERLLEAERALEQGLTLDLTSMLLRSAAEALSEITGDMVSDEIVQSIFSRFCVGK